MEKLNKGDKIYLDNEKIKESFVNDYLARKDGIVQVYEYIDNSGYGSKNRLFLCENTKYEMISIIRQTWIDSKKLWIEEEITFDTDSFAFMKAIIIGKKDEPGGKYSLLHDYADEISYDRAMKGSFE